VIACEGASRHTDRDTVNLCHVAWVWRS